MLFGILCDVAVVTYDAHLNTNGCHIIAKKGL